jgi:hypothetical protein
MESRVGFNPGGCTDVHTRVFYMHFSGFVLQMLPAVTPEQYPLEPPPGSAAAEHDGHLAAMHAQQQREQLREQHHTDRYVFETFPRFYMSSAPRFGPWLLYPVVCPNRDTVQG